MALLYGRTGRLTAKNGGFWPRRAVVQAAAAAEGGPVDQLARAAREGDGAAVAR